MTNYWPITKGTVLLIQVSLKPRDSDLIIRPVASTIKIKQPKKSEFV